MTSPTTISPATKPNECVIDVHPNIFDLKGKLTVDLYNATNPEEPVTFVHVDQSLVSISPKPAKEYLQEPR